MLALSNNPERHHESMLAAIRREADKCVKCALCAPHCPTYLIALDENESPRGRISLMQGLASGQLQLTPHLHAHLDHCLDCRACEKVCPSGVRYGALLDTVRQHLAPPARRHRAAWLAALLTRPRWHGLLGAVTRGLRGRGLRTLLRHTPVRRLVEILPTGTAGRKERGNTAGTRGRVFLFAGCTGDLLDSGALESARAVLARLGYTVITSRPATCCGALHAHQGEGEHALRLARETMAQYRAQTNEEDVPLVYIATGCGAQLGEYATLPWPGEAERAAARAFADATQEIGAFLLAHLRDTDIALQPLATTLHVHEPCSQRNVLRTSATTYELLKLIPELVVRPLPDNAHCCGGAGSYFIAQPRQAEAVFARKQTTIAASGEDVTRVVTSNPGCAAMFRRAGYTVLHPAEVIAAQIEETVARSA